MIQGPHIATQILGETADIVAVGKPASMPVHVSGQYRKNTLLSIMEAEQPQLGKLHPVHRLDKMVSGVLLFARSPTAAERVRTLIEVLHSIFCKAYVQTSDVPKACSQETCCTCA